MIPKIIWQTYETNFSDLLDDAKSCSKTWTDINPSWQYKYLNAKERKDFVFKYFDKEWYEIYTECKLNIVKANIWRCMALYVYGGVYCDLDTICIEPIESWIKNEYSLVVSKDDDGDSNDYCINVFAAKPRSAAIHDILKNIKNNIINNNIVIDNVIELTGEKVWSNTLSGQHDKYSIYCYESGSNIFNGNAVKHIGTFKDWYKNGYKQWNRGQYEK